MSSVIAKALHLTCRTKSSNHLIATRSVYYKFERRFVPPLQKPRESPYIVGPYLKPDYLPREYITDPIKHRDDNDLDHFIYEPKEVRIDQTKGVQLLLLEDIESLGVAGQIVEVPSRRASSDLVVRKRAEYATEFTLKWYKFGPRTAQSASSALALRTIRLLKSQAFPLPVSRDADLEPWHLSLALRLAGCLCDPSVIKDIEKIENGAKCIVVVNNHEKVSVEFIYVKAESPTA